MAELLSKERKELAYVACVGFERLVGVVALVPLVAGAAYGGTLFLLALTGGMGMGDVKLAAVLGLAAPTTTVAVASPAIAFLSGGVVSLVVLVLRGRGSRIPFGPFLLLGYAGALAVAVACR